MQKLLGDKLYVFDLTPYEITQQTEDASVIYVQNECIDGYKELNVSLADKIEGFNQFVLCITDPWKEGVEPAPGYTLTISGNSIHDNIDVYFDNVQQPVNMTYENVEADTVIKIVPTQDVSRYELIEGATWDSEAQAWLATMSDEDLTIEINYTPVYTITLNGTNLTNDNVTIKINNEAVELAGSYEVPASVWFEIYPTFGPSNYSLSSSPSIEWSDDEPVHWYTKDQDVTINLAYTAPKQDPELAWSANSATVNMVSPEGVPTLTNPHNVDVTYSSSDTDVAYFTPENGDIPLLAGNGNATISAIFAGNETYNASTVSYDLTVEGGSGESGSSDDQ